MKQLPPLRLTPAYYEAIEAEINAILAEELFLPLVRAVGMKPSQLTNARSPLIGAIENGSVWYADGRFQGSFNAAITKELRSIGAKWNATSRSWSLPASKLPAQVRMAQGAASAAYDDMRRRVLTTLDDINVQSVTRLDRLKDKYTKTIEWMDGDFYKTVAKVAIPPKLTDKQRDIIAAQWSENLDLYIKDWTDKSILNLRQQVQGNAFVGQRAENLVKMIQTEYGVSARKAHFLARQETSLLMSKFRETRYKDIGVTRYRWSISGSAAPVGNVRDDHAELNGKIFSWDSPPVTNTDTGARNHPGEDYNCKCVAIPVVD